ncbi:MAG TPA: Tim44-like domain-containing protein [Burkholderiales bacterium]
MKRFLGVIFATLLGLGVAMQPADAARRLGGGGNLGSQRQVQPAEPRRAPDAAPAPQPQPQAQPQAQPAPATPQGSRWLGPLAGLAAGGLLGAWLFGGAFDGIKPMDLLVIAALVAGMFFLLRALRRPPDRAGQYAGVGPTGTVPAADIGALPAPATPSNVPPDFDISGFLRQARLSFARLQAANDRKDLRDVRDFTTPEMCEAIAREFAERGDEPQRTRVESLDARLLEAVVEGNRAWASVRFTGSLQDEWSHESESFDEIWNVSKDLRDPNSVWLIAGIQQVS